MSETPNPNFLQELEKKADAFFEGVKEEVNHVLHPDADPVAAAAAQIAAAPSTPLPNEAPALAAESATAPASTESPNAADTPPAGDATHADGEDPNVALAAGEPTAAAGFAPSAAGSGITSPSAASSIGETVPKTFEQRVEERFLKLESAFMQLPASIHAVMSSGSMEAEDFAKAVMKHVFEHI